MKKLLVALLFVSGCAGEPVMDCTSEATMKASSEKMRAEMSEEEKAAFGRDVAAIMLSGALTGFDPSKIKSAEDGDTQALVIAKEKLHGKTVAEIHAEAEAIRNKRRGQGS